MRKYMSGVLAILLILASGCVEPGGAEKITYSSTDGVVINSFRPDISEVYPDEEIFLEMTVQNIGDDDATNVQAYIYGYPGDWTCASPLQTMGTIRGVDRNLNQPGLSDNAEWTIKAPGTDKVPQGFSMGAHVKARVYYEYQTVGTVIFTTANRNYVSEQRKIGETVSMPVQTDIKGGPVSMDITPPSRVQIAKDGTVNETIVVTLNNVGGGDVFDTGQDANSLSRDNMNLVDITVKLDGTEVTDCSYYVESAKEKEKLVDGYTVATCDVSLTAPTTTESHTIEVTTDYGYVVTSGTTVSVSNV